MFSRVDTQLIRGSNGSYTLTKRLAAGGMGTIWLACNEANEWVALKQLYPHFMTNPDVVGMFEHEAALTLRLEHPMVPAAIEFGRDSDAYFLAMEYVPGVAITSALIHPGGLALRAWMSLATQLLEGMVHIHERRSDSDEPLGIVHHDITPSNLLTTEEGCLKLIDFGIASSSLRPYLASGSPRGTPGYIAPEVIAGRADVDARADIFSAGVILWEAAVGARMFPGGALAAINATMYGPPPSPCSLRQDFPQKLEWVVMRALAFDPNDRFPSARAMARALEQAAQVVGCGASDSALARQILGRAGT